jgi:hypothetical protein
MTVNSNNPVFIFRDDDKRNENFDRLEKFLKPAVDFLKEEAAEKESASL